MNRLTGCSYSGICSLVSLIFCSGAVCQSLGTPTTQECALAPDRLHSDPLREKAWGAYLANVCRMPELAGEIAAEMERLDPAVVSHDAWSSESFWAVHSMLDALIRLRQPLPTSVLASAKAFPTEATILMLQNPVENRALLAEIHAHPGGAEWVAAGNALARTRAAGFARAVLAEIRITQSVWVSDTGSPVGRGFGASAASGSPTMRVPSGFPPVAIYRLTAHFEGKTSHVVLDGPHRGGGELVSDGATPIYSQRTILQPGVEQTLSWPPEGYCSQCLEIEYLAELAGVSKSDVEKCIQPQTPLKWSSLMQLNSEIQQALTNQEIALRQLVKSLIANGALDPSELGIRIHIEIDIEDRRTSRSVPLPAFAQVEFRLE